MFGVWSFISYTEATWARDEAKTATIAETKQRKKAEKQQADANRENENFYWRFAVEARDTNEPIKAAHLLSRAATSLGVIPPEQKSMADRPGIIRDGFAASVQDGPLVRSWVHSAVVWGSNFSRDESRVRSKRFARTATGSTNSAETNWFGISLLGFMGIVLLVVFARKTRDRRGI